MAAAILELPQRLLVIQPVLEDVTEAELQGLGPRLRLHVRRRLGLCRGGRVGLLSPGLGRVGSFNRELGLI